METPASPVDQFMQQYGQTTAAWSMLEMVLSMWFCHLVAPAGGAMMGQEIFYSGRNFSTRRDMMRAALRVAKPDAETKEFLTEALKLAGGYSADRNRIAHGLFLTAADKSEAMIGAPSFSGFLKDHIDIQKLKNIGQNVGLLSSELLACLPYRPNCKSPKEALERLRELPRQAQDDPPSTNREAP